MSEIKCRCTIFKCSCIISASSDPESPDVEEAPDCPEHGENAQYRRDSETLWKLHAALAEAMGVDISEPFPEVDVFAEAEKRLRSMRDSSS